ncbi:polyprenyl synthetase family protein [Streptomyces sp. NPDC057107]|uniref:polyprenyl synthetase family protein n=1 Tax=Streptomyces sp. NPDC057107 TaxID=3346021 RepID=UPI0036317DDB
MSIQAPAALFDHDAVRRAVDATLAAYMNDQIRTAHHRGLPREPLHALSEFLGSGGKRIRPVLCVAGWQAGGGIGTPEPVLRAAASLEMFHASVLVHDDIIDASDTRRGHPTVHRQAGTAAAILIGDLALILADDLLHGAGLAPEQLTSVLRVANRLRIDTIYGQYLDLAHSGRPPADVAPAMAIVHHKTAKYTVEGPLLLGAALAGADPAVSGLLHAYGIPIGEAFQLRDDLLGIFGNPHETGKPALDDLREGKATVLMALALQQADPDQLHTLRRYVGDPKLTSAQAEQVRAVLVDTGARTAVENMIEQRRHSALSTLSTADLPAHIITALHSQAFSATARTT